MNSTETIDVVPEREKNVDGTSKIGQTTYKSVKSNPDSTYVISNFVYLIYGLLASLLGIRFMFTLLLANRENSFANLVFSATDPFVWPFKSLFRINTNLGNSGARIEVETIIAIAVYGLIAWGINSAVHVNNIPRKDI
jgi:YGGT family